MMKNRNALEQHSRNQTEKRSHAEAQRHREKTRIDSDIYWLISLRLCASAPLREKTREIHEVFPNVQELEMKSLVATPA
jgi:hypothetical protein